MAWEGWLPLAQQCPCCGAGSCAVYRGYYKRKFVCPEMEFCGWLVVRSGYCRRQKRRFACLPDFVIPRRRISWLGLARLLECHRSALGDFPTMIAEWTAGLNDEEFYVPRSTARVYLNLATRVPP